MQRPLPILALALAALAGSGCASIADTAGYPSLERRAVELRLNGPADSPPADPTPPPVTAGLATAITALEADAARGDAAFRAALAATQSLVGAARGAPLHGAAWFSAQAAISGLEQTRAPTRVALAELDRLHVAAEVDGRSADAALLGAAAARVGDLAAGQTAAFERLSGQLPQ